MLDNTFNSLAGPGEDFDYDEPLNFVSMLSVLTPCDLESADVQGRQPQVRCREMATLIEEPSILSLPIVYACYSANCALSWLDDVQEIAELLQAFCRPAARRPEQFCYIKLRRLACAADTDSRMCFHTLGSAVARGAGLLQGPFNFHIPLARLLWQSGHKCCALSEDERV